MIDYLPRGYDSYLNLDSDTQVIKDIELGFIKAKKHGLAMVPAPLYSLDYYGDFRNVMLAEEVALHGQLQYNTGVIFFSLYKDVNHVFRLWVDFGKKYCGNFPDDQPFLSLALEKLKFNPYTLSRGYNYRGMGEVISGIIRI